MLRKKRKRSSTALEGSHFPTLTPPVVEDVANQKWYRRGSDMSQAIGPGEYEQEEEEQPEEGYVHPPRVQWSNQMEFLMSCIATSVGLGNVWRFPFVAYQNGGGAFLIPYLIVLFIIGKPMYYLECILGQFSSRNSVRCWSLCPAMKGVGYAQTLACSYILSYYVMIIALCLYYLVMSFFPVLPWAVCDPKWDNCVPSDISLYNGTPPKDSSSSAELYFVNEVLQQSAGVEGALETPIWYLVIPLFVSWLIIFLIVAQGVKSSGKAAYFLAIFPYIVMFILLVTALTLPGATNGILYLIRPHWEMILKIDVWYAAVTQAFFSLSVCIGAIIMFSSYNGFRQNIYRDSMIVTALDTLTSLLSGITIFSILGNLAYNLDTDVDEVVGSGGTGLAFVSYPDAIAKSIQPQVYAIMFFVMMSVLGIGSAVALFSTINTVLLDRFPHVPTIYTSAFGCLGGFIIGLIYTTPGGQFVLELVDFYGGTFLVLYSAITEVIGIFWIYGLEEFCLDVEYMLKRKPTVYWRVSWAVLTPGLMMSVFFYALFTFDALVVGGDYVYPTAGYAAGYGILGIGMVLVPLYILKAMFKNRSKLSETFASKKTWGPRSPAESRHWKAFKEEARTHHKKSKLKHICMSLCGKYKTNLQAAYSMPDKDKFDKSKSPFLVDMPGVSTTIVRPPAPAPAPSQSQTPTTPAPRRMSQFPNQGVYLGQSPGQGPGQGPSQGPSQGPGQGPGQGPSPTQGTSQSRVPGQRPGPGQGQGQGQGQGSSQAPGQDPNNPNQGENQNQNQERRN